MTVQPKIYVPGQNREADKLNELYEQLNGSTFAERTAERVERDPNDPFGFNEPYELTDDYDVAKHVAVKLTKFFALCVQDYRLSPRAAMFAAELMALNIFNAKDIPASAEEINDARKAAYEYFVASLPLVPDPKPVR
jgi:hypothetical protein